MATLTSYVGVAMKTRHERSDEILEFCKTPRTIMEIGGFLGFTTFAWVKRIFLNYLIENGELKLKYPTKPRMGRQKQMFMTTGYEIGVLTQKTVLELCMTPHRKREIAQHFQVSVHLINSVVNPLIAEGKLVTDDNPNVVWQKVITAGSDVPTDRIGQIKYFCQEPRTRREVLEFLGLSPNRTQDVIHEQIGAGNIRMLMPDKPKSNLQKYVVAGVEALTITADEMARFCETPRTRKEIADRFGLEQRAARTYILEYIESGKLARTIPDKPISRMQKYIKV